LIECPTKVIVSGIEKMFKPKLVLGFVGRIYWRHLRKGQDVLAKLKEFDWLQIKQTEGKLKLKQLPNFYNSVDYVLVTSRVEGGPLCLLEGAAMGKKIICPKDVGLAGQFPEVIIGYNFDDWENSLVNILKDLYQKKYDVAKYVEKYTWDRWIDEHDKFFWDSLKPKKSHI
jgi:hypothetical protein